MTGFQGSLILAVISVVGLFVLQTIFKKKEKELSADVGSVNLFNATDKKSVLSSSKLSFTSTDSGANGLQTNRYGTDDEMYSATDSESEDSLETDDKLTAELPEKNQACVWKENACNLFEEVDLLFEGNEENHSNALTLLKQEENQYHENADFLGRLAKSYQLQAAAFGENNYDEQKKDFIWQGLTFAEKALAIDPSNFSAHKWYAILVGMKGQFSNFQQKIECGFLFHKHLMESLKGNPHDPAVYHLLGRFKYEIANLSWYERAFAYSFFAELPSFNMDDALVDFKQAEDLNMKPSKENRLYVSKCYIALGKYEEAYRWLKLTREVHSITDKDRLCDEECQSLITQYKC